jgi:hypothetical protein
VTVVSMDLSLALLVAATVGNGIATGATLDQTFKQLPTRRRIGADASPRTRAARTWVTA